MNSVETRKIMARNLTRYVALSGKTQREIAEYVGVAPSTFNDWLKAKKYPRIDKIEKIAEYFKILKSDLIEEKSEERQQMQKNNDAIADIIVRMRTDSNFLSIVTALNKMDPEKISNLSAFLK